MNAAAFFVYDFRLPGWIMVSLWGVEMGLQSHTGIQSVLNECLVN